MELWKFRIINYKSIKDSGECYLNPTLTILAGMNESGKTSLLEALRDFNPNNNISEGAERIDQIGNPEISLWFKLTNDDVSNLWVEIADDEVLDSELEKFLVSNPLKITKKFDNKYYLDEALESYLAKRFKHDYKAYLTKFLKKINSLKEINMLSDVDFTVFDKDNSAANLDLLIKKISVVIKTTRLTKVTNPDGTVVTKEVPLDLSVDEKGLRDDIQSQIDEIWDNVPAIAGYCDCSDFIEAISNALIERIPEIIFFSSFEDILEFQFPIEELDKKRINVDLCNLAGIDIDFIKSQQDYQKRLNYLSTKSATISNKFKTDWLQDEINIKFNTEDKIIQFGIQEENDTNLYRAEQRSQGFQWFLSFYIRLNAQDAVNKIILVDEPGLYLHAKAQEDVLKVFETMANENVDTKVVISTHSPYLIDIDHLDRILLVEKDKKDGTKITKSHSKSKQETLTPVLTKMGFDISKSALIKQKNLLLEGISDYHYLKAFEVILGLSKNAKEVALIPSVGASKIPQIASLCIGWGLDYVALFDNDKEGQKTAKLMDKEFGEYANYSFICEKEDCAIEDLFTKDDFNKYVLPDDSQIDDETQNSQFVKTKKLDKVLLAKLFSDKVKSPKAKLNISDTTKKNFEDLFECLLKRLSIELQKSTKSL